MKKNKELNTRQIELFEEYYDIDKESKLVSYPLHFDKASDILDKTTKNPKKPLFKTEILETINSLIEKTPFGYKVSFNFEIDDYEGYNPKEIINSFNDTLELNQYSARKSRQKKELLASNLILVGIILLFIMVIAKANEAFGEGIRTEIASEVINIAAWVFVWEAVTMLFLEHSEQNIFALKIRRRVSQIIMSKTNDDKPLAIENSNQIFGNWENEGKIKRTGKLFLLISSFAFLFLAFYSFYEFYLNLTDPEFDISYLAFYLIVAIISAIILLSAGLGGISLYMGKKNKISKFVGPYAIIISIGIIITITLAIVSNTPLLIFSSVATTIIDILYITGYIIDKTNSFKN